MANERLRAAVHRRRATTEAVAVAVGVDPKTVHRWIGGRVPHPRHRWAVARFLHEDAEFLWPGAAKAPDDPTAIARAEIVNAYSFRSDLPTSTWWSLVKRAEKHIDLLGYTLYFLPLQHPELITTLEKKSQDGCEIRMVIADPRSRHVTDRDKEEDLAMTLGVRIQTTMKYLSPLFDCPGFELRAQDRPLYNSVFRFDGEMPVTPHLHATPGSAAPLLHLRRLGSDGLWSRFMSHFDSIWNSAVKWAPSPPSASSPEHSR